MSSSNINFNWWGLLLVAFTIAIAGFLGWQAGLGHLDLPKLIFVAVGGVLVFVLGFHPHSSRNLLLAACGAIILGWRGVSVLPQFTFYPAETFIWFGCVNYLIVNTMNRVKVEIQLPLFAKILIIGAFVGTLVGLIESRELAYVFLEFRTFIVFAPLFLLVTSAITSSVQIFAYIKVLVLSGVFISCLGIVEYFLPSVSTVVPMLFGQPIALRMGFEGSLVRLASFEFWGTTAVTVILVPLVPFCFVLQRQSLGLNKLLWVVCATVLSLGIVTSGYRSALIGLLVALVLLPVADRPDSLRFYLLIFAGAIAILFLVPDEIFLRFYATFLPLSGMPDTSVLIRFAAFSSGIESLVQHPLGIGWDSAAKLGIGVHNDWIFFGLSTGVVGLLAIVCWYITTMHKLWLARARFISNDVSRHQLALGLFAGLTGYAVSMFGGAGSQVTPIATCFWIMFCLAVRFTQLEFGNKALSGKS